MKTTDIPAGTIVVGIDGSPGSDQALVWAQEQAVLEQRPLTLVHGTGPSNTAWLDLPGFDRAVVIEAIHSDGQKLLDRAAKTLAMKAPELTVRQVLQMADPRVVLLELSRDAAMVVLGSHGRGPIRSLLLGSVSVAVSEHASCPVVVLRPRSVGVARNGVLVGVDGTALSKAALEFAYQQASLRSLPLTVMHCHLKVASATPTAHQMFDDGEGLEAERLALSESVAGMGEKFPDVKVRLELALGLPDERLVRASATMDMVVVGCHPRGRLDALLYMNVGRGVVEHAKCIVAIVPSGP